LLLLKFLKLKKFNVFLKFFKRLLKILPITLKNTFETRATKSNGSLPRESGDTWFYDYKVGLKLN